MIDDKTPNAALPLPHIDNFLEEDVERLRAALTMIDEQLAAADAALSALVARVETLESAEPCLPLSGGTVSGDVTVTGSLTADVVHNAVWNE